MIDAVRTSTLLTGFQSGGLDLLAQALLVATAAFYLFCLRRLVRRGREIPWRRATAFLAGLLAVWIAVGSGLAAYDDTNVTVHVVQHLLLMMVAPPLLALGRPVVVVMQAGTRRRQVRLARVLSSRAARVLTHPAMTWSVYFASMVAMLADRPVYHYLINHPLVHDASHAWLILIGILYWEPLVGGATSGRRVSHPLRAIAVLASMPFEVVVGIWLRYQTTPLDPVNSVADTQRAGEAFVVGAALVSTAWLVTILVQWGGAALREDRRIAARPPSGEWTTPWWMETKPNGVAESP